MKDFTLRKPLVRQSDHRLLRGNQGEVLTLIVTSQSSAVALVVVAGQRTSVGKLQITWERSRAWIEGFSSMAMTTALSGGAM